MEPVRPKSPFCGSLSRATLTAEEVVRTARSDAVANKWHVLRNLAEIRKLLGIPHGALGVLHALLSFHHETVLTGTDLVVFPSNAELSLRAHGMAEPTLRRHLAWLGGAGLVIRRDSPNGKRYARRGAGGEVIQAFGFDLGPLVARAAEFATLAEEVRADRRARKLLGVQITVLRRDIAKSVELGRSEALPGPWEDYELVLASHSQGLLRTLDRDGLEARATALRELLADVDKSLRILAFQPKTSANDPVFGRHNQNSNPDAIRIEPESREGPHGSSAQADGESAAPVARASADNARPAPLGLVLEACPDLADWSSGPIRNRQDLIGTARLVRAAFGITPSAWEDACDVLGEGEAAACLAAILQKREAVKSPGGYLRKLVAKAKDGEFSPVPMLMALLRARLRRAVPSAARGRDMGFAPSAELTRPCQGGSTRAGSNPSAGACPTEGALAES